MQIFTVLHDFRGGGAEKMAVLIANEFAKLGHQSTIICATECGPFRDSVTSDVKIVNFNKTGMQGVILPLSRLMRQHKDAIFISHLTHVNVSSIIAGILSGHRRLFAVEHNNYIKSRTGVGSYIVKLCYFVAPILYARLSGIVSVSDSVFESIPIFKFLKPPRAKVINNPFNPIELISACEEPPDHVWFKEHLPVLVACGRLTEQKNYKMLLQAFSKIRKFSSARLIILGEGDELRFLSDLVQSLQISTEVCFMGFVKNPATYFAKARLFVSTSDWEGLPMTLIEALYCGANVVTTDSCSAARNILLDSRFGLCVQRGDLNAFVSAVEQQLRVAPSPIEDKRAFLSSYQSDRVAEEYLNFIADD